MSCKDFKTNIDDAEGKAHEYWLHQMPPSEALPLKYKLVKLLGGAMTTLLGEVDLTALKTDKSAALPALGLAVQSLFTEAEPMDAFNLVKEILSHAKRDGADINLDHAYGDNYLEMYQAVGWILRSNYGSFLAGLGQLGGLRKVVPVE
jgi:hypothetical protein